MSIADFSAVVQSEVYKKWLEKLDKNIITATAKSMREAEQRAEKTDFYITTNDIKRMYKTLTNKDLSSSKAAAAIAKIGNLAGSNLVGQSLKFGRAKGVFFESIGFGTITSRVSSVFDELDGVAEAYTAAAEAYLTKKKAEITSNYPAESQAEALSSAEKYAKNIGFGEFFHKGHVVGIATNTAKAFRDSLLQAVEFEEAQKKLLIDVLDKYIDRLEKEDLLTANLPNSLHNDFYAKYTKNNRGKYLVEIQLKSTNIASGSATSKPIEELRKIFGNPSGDLSSILKGSSTLGIKLLQTKGSPSWIELLGAAIAQTIATGKSKLEEYSIPNTLVGSSQVKIGKSNNRDLIRQLKAQKAKIASAKSKIKVPALRDLSSGRFTSLASLQNIINDQLAKTIQKNMGAGDRKDILNYRTGRFAESVKVERMSQSREGMITAFYTYMRNPYGTFSEGGAQGLPRSRDPKLLISKSIREIAATQVSNRMRAVLA